MVVSVHPIIRAILACSAFLTTAFRGEKPMLNRRPDEVMSPLLLQSPLPIAVPVLMVGPSLRFPLLPMLSRLLVLTLPAHASSDEIRLRFTARQACYSFIAHKNGGGGGYRTPVREGVTRQSFTGLVSPFDRTRRLVKRSMVRVEPSLSIRRGSVQDRQPLNDAPRWSR